MEAPYAIATLPAPLDKEHGRQYAAPVAGLKGSRKRKRHEVAVAVDGEGVSIYNVQTQSLVASYAVPAQTYFCSQPCSIYSRASSERAAQRLTYTITRASANGNNRKLVCHRESVRNRQHLETEYAAPKKTDCIIPDGRVCSLDTVTTAEGEFGSVIVSYTDGRVVSVRSDLAATREERVAFRTTLGETVEYSAVLDLQSAQKGVLRHRDDVLASLEDTAWGSVDGNLLAQVIRSKGRRHLQLHALHGHQKDSLQRARAGLRCILSLELPPASRQGSAHAKHEVHASSGKLYSLIGGSVSVVDLQEIVPKTIAQLESRHDPITGLARLSSSLVMTTSLTSATLYDTTHGSTVAFTGLLLGPVPNANGRKRKRDDIDLEASTTPISAFAQLGLLVFMAQDQLAGIQLSGSVLDQARENKQITLSNAMGQGTAHRSIVPGGKTENMISKQADWVANVDALIEHNDVEGLEALVASDEALGQQRKPTKSHRKHDAEHEDMGGDITAYDDLWPLPEPFDRTKLDSQRALCILSKVFSYAPDEPQIEVRIASRKLLEWLALAGYLNRRSLEKALLPQDAGVQREPIQPGDIIMAISEVDDEFQLMHDLLSLSVQWELPEVVQATCLLIRSFDATSDQSHMPEIPHALLTAVETDEDVAMSNGEVALVNGDAESHVESESKAAETELDHVERILTSGLEVRSGTLRVTLERLHNFPASDVKRAMRSMMTQKDLIFLIHALRIELADGGWTSRYAGAEINDERYESNNDFPLSSMVDVIPGDGESGPSNQAIRAIGDLLNCAVDAVGTSGWLVGLSGDAAGTGELVESLRAEVSAGLEGCYESNTLSISLAELDRFIATRPTSKRGQLNGVGEAALPVGGKAQQVLNLAGKSKQVRAMEKSKQVGKYSIDRIRF